MVKNKALPDSAAPPRLLSLSLSFSLSPSQTWPYQGWSHVSSLSHWCRSSRGYPLDPAGAGPRHHATSDPNTSAGSKELSCVGSVIMQLGSNYASYPPDRQMPFCSPWVPASCPPRWYCWGWSLPRRGLPPSLNFPTWWGGNTDLCLLNNIHTWCQHHPAQH